jgi:hypothetical protein
MTKDDDGNLILRRVYIWYIPFWNYFRISDTPSAVGNCKFKAEFYASGGMGTTPVNKTPSANYVEYI